jgi:hypothetical protein
MIYSQAIASNGQFLSSERIIETLQAGIGNKFRNQGVLVLIPDHTRSLPLPFLFRALVEILCDTWQLDFMVALGTHPPLNESRIKKQPIRGACR